MRWCLHVQFFGILSSRHPSDLVADMPLEADAYQCLASITMFLRCHRSACAALAYACLSWQTILLICVCRLSGRAEQVATCATPV